MHCSVLSVRIAGRVSAHFNDALNVFSGRVMHRFLMAMGLSQAHLFSGVVARKKRRAASRPARSQGNGRTHRASRMAVKRLRAFNREKRRISSAAPTAQPGATTAAAITAAATTAAAITAAAITVAQVEAAGMAAEITVAAAAKAG